MKKTNKRIVSSVASIALCASLVVGGSYALFTSESEVNVAVTSGTVKVVASVNEGSLKTYSMGEAQTAGKFENGGTAGFNEYSQLELSLMTPGDKAEFTVDIANESNVAIQYRVSFGVTGGLADVLDCSATNADNTWVYAEAKEQIPSVAVTVELPESVGDTYQSITDTVVTVKVEAVQGNAPMVDKWDGTADISWYNENETEFELSTAEQLAGLAALVDNSPVARNANFANAVTFDGKTLKLTSDVDLEAYDENGNRISFDPIGYGYDVYFEGTFDGQGHTISNLYQNGWALGYDYSTEGGGLFASVKDATIKNLNIDGSEIVMECIDMGTVVGYSYGNCTYENISVKNATIANYQRYTGGIVGEVNGTQIFKNVDISDSTVSSLWGDFDCSIGGIVGGKYGEATLVFEDCDVACELNVYNDVTSSYQWYAYRRAGMLIGNTEETVTVGDRKTATASYLTAKNCTVTYGDWINYTYCEFAGTSWPYVRVQGSSVGQSSAYSNPRYGVATDANGNKVVDDNHVHNEGEDHNILLVFDQLFGGGQGVYGTATHDGVTVNYPASYNPGN